MVRAVMAALAIGATAALAAVASAAYAFGPEKTEIEDLVAARQGGMTMSVFTLGALSGAANSDKPLTGAAFAAGGLKTFALSLPSLFGPETANVENTRALPAIWEEGSDFAARIAEYQAATAELSDAAKADNREAFTAALARTKNACKACHDSYRLEPPA